MLIFKIVTAAVWKDAEARGVLTGMPVDLADGYIHFSTAEQLRQTAEKHFTGQRDLVLVSVEAADLGPDLKWEISRGGALFPHLYAPLRLHHVHDATLLLHDAAGALLLPEAIP